MNDEQLIERVTTLYEQTFSDCDEGRVFLGSKGINNAELYSRHHIGYCNGSLRTILPSTGSVLRELTELGILLENDVERFLGCLTFPMMNVDGKIINIMGLNLRTGEYLSLPTRGFSAWNIGIIKSCTEVYVVKTILDALSMEVAGYPNVIAVFGRGMGDEEKRLFKEYGVNALRVKEGANDLLVKEGAKELAKQLIKVKPGAETAEKTQLDDRPQSISGGQGFTVTYGPRRYEVRGLEKKAKYLRATLRVEHAGKLLIDTQDLYSSKGRRTLSQELCRLFDEIPETIEADLTRLIKQCENYEPSRTEADIPTMPTWEKEEAEEFGKKPDLIEQIQADFQACGLVAEEANRLLCYLAMTSRKTDEPLCILILSSSGAGKTFLQDAVLSFCPPEDMIKVTSLSGKALFYRDPTSLKHKVLAIEEEAGAEQADYALRSLITSKQLSVEAVVKDLATGRLVTMRNVVQGRTAVFLTTTNPYVNPETRSRFLVLSVDESREQTRRILEFQRISQTIQGLAHESGSEDILRKHRNFQRLLRPVKVVNPYADQLGYGDDRLQGRRDQPKYLNLIKALAFLRQMQKPLFHEKHTGAVGKSASIPYIKVDRDDIRLANTLARDTMGHSLDELSRPSRDLLKLLEEMMRGKDGDTKYTRRDIREQIGWTNTRLHIHLKELLDFEFLAVEAGRNGLLHRYRLAYEGEGKDGSKFLAGLKDVDQLQEPKE
jgi:hypothetical protein